MCCRLHYRRLRTRYRFTLSDRTEGVDNKRCEKLGTFEGARPGNGGKRERVIYTSTIYIPRNDYPFLNMSPDRGYG